MAEAIRFFAEVGFEGQTRALALRLGVTQPLLYRYFPDKDALIERVYQEVFLNGWEPAWGDLLTDRSRPLRDRLVDFYRAYCQTNFSYERLRLYLFAGLKDDRVGQPYMNFMRDNLFIPLVREIRAECGLAADPAIRDMEVECVAGLHGAIGFAGLRRWVFMVPMQEGMDSIVAALIGNFLAGAPATFRALA